MKALIAILILMALGWVIKQLTTQYDEAKRQSGYEQPAVPSTPSASAELPGMPASLESTLANAQKQGAEGLAQFLRSYRHAIRDPRLAAIELDYVVLVSLRDPAEAKRVFKAVEQRTPRSSPIYPRVQRLAKNYQ